MGVEHALHTQAHPSPSSPPPCHSQSWTLVVTATGSVLFIATVVTPVPRSLVTARVGGARAQSEAQGVREHARTHAPSHPISPITSSIVLAGRFMEPLLSRTPAPPVLMTMVVPGGGGGRGGGGELVARFQRAGGGSSRSSSRHPVSPPPPPPHHATRTIVDKVQLSQHNIAGRLEGGGKHTDQRLAVAGGQQRDVACGAARHSARAWESSESEVPRHNLIALLRHLQLPLTWCW